MTVTPVTPSGSTNGGPIKVAAAATPGTAIHTSVAGTSQFDEIYLWVTNSDTVQHTLTLEIGGVADPDNLFPKGMSIAANSGPVPVLTGIRLNNSKAIAAFADSANKLIIEAIVNRYAP